MRYNQVGIYRIDNSEKKSQDFFNSLNKYITNDFSGIPDECYLNLNGTVVRLVMYDNSFLHAIQLCLNCSVVKTCPYDYTIVLWKSDINSTNFQEMTCVINEEQAHTILVVRDNGLIRGFDWETNTFYCGYPDTSIEKLASIGHLFAVQFHKILKNKSGKLIHGACVGINGKGVLLCARGGMGKSTLAVAALLSGFEYVSDDYLILDEEDGILSASPIYSIIKLTYTMYNKLCSNLQDAVHIGDALGGKKCVFNISSFKVSFRWKYPVRLCMMPVIVPDLSEPSIVPCSGEEKGRSITQVVHSTISQLGDKKDNVYTLKLIRMLQNQIFYKIQLSQDIYANVDCLRAFLTNL